MLIVVLLIVLIREVLVQSQGTVTLFMTLSMPRFLTKLGCN